MASSSRVTADDVCPVFLGGQDLDLDDDGRGDDHSDSFSSTENLADTFQPVQRAPEANDCESKTHYLSVPSSKAKKVLFAMCLGLCAEKDPDDPKAICYLSEFNVEPYVSAENKKPFRPMHITSLTRFNSGSKCLKYQTKNDSNDTTKKGQHECCQYIVDTPPVTNQKVILFLQAEEEKFSSILDMATRIESRTIAGRKASLGTSEIVHCSDQDG
jgi:hypothetical protein